MKSYNIFVSVSGSPKTLEWVFKVMTADFYGYDFITFGMPVYNEYFLEKGDLNMASQMNPTLCELIAVYATENTIELNLQSPLPIPSGWLHAFGSAFSSTTFTAFCTDEAGEPIITYYNMGA